LAHCQFEFDIDTSALEENRVVATLGISALAATCSS